MKKNLLFCFVFFFASFLHGQGCLPEGITFTTQEQIDNFQTDYPGCTEIEGNVYISGYDFRTNITNLNGLSVITKINGELWISYLEYLENLSGLEGLTTISGGLYLFYNFSLSNLDALENLNSIGGDLWIEGQPFLTNLNGLENVSPNSINNLTIFNNYGLSSCNIQSICSYLSNPNGVVNIYENAEGCNNPSEIANLCGFTMPCLPYGNYYFFTQSDIDNFSSNYPGCHDLQGGVSIIAGTTNPDSIINLNGLINVTAVEGSLYISGLSLPNLIGLNNLEYVWGHLTIESNPKLNNLIGLDNFTFVSGILSIIYNDSIQSLNGLEKLENIGWALSIKENPFLSTCEIQSICDYLANPNGEVNIENNAPGCNSREEVEAACLVGIEKMIQENELSIFPNPSSSRLTIQFILEKEEQVRLVVLNNLGQTVSTLANERRSAGEHEFNWNAEGIPAGVYFYQIQIGNQAGTGKMVVVR